LSALAAWLALATTRHIRINIILVLGIIHAVHAFTVASEEFVIATNT
jgi:hypothetical protein